MRYRNIQGLRAIAALMVVSCHMFLPIAPMRTHWAKPFFSVVGPAGVDIFFVISGFIIYHVMQRSIASIDIVGKWRAVYVFAIKRFIRIYPLYWIVFAASCLLMAWLPPTPLPSKKPLIELLSLVDSTPNFRVFVAWTLTYEVYFYAVAALSLILFAKRWMKGLSIWFVAIAAATLWSILSPLSEPLDYVFAPILLEFLLGIAVAMLVDNGVSRFPVAMLAVASVWMIIGTLPLIHHPGSFPLHVICWGMPAAILVYGMVALEVRQRWMMPRVLQYLGNASFSIYLWHIIVFNVVAEMFARLGWVGVVSPVGLTALMVAITLGIGFLSYHYLEKPSLRLLGKMLVSRRSSREGLIGASAA